MSAPIDRSITRPQTLVTRHLRVGWWALFAFLLLGIGLEALHGLKIGWYLDAGNETRRLMWTLAHAHGTLVALIQLGFAGTLHALSLATERSLERASQCLLLGGGLLPTGFFLGGIVIYEGDPGLGVLLVPPAALLLAAGVFLTARAVHQATRRGDDSSSAPELDE